MICYRPRCGVCVRLCQTGTEGAQVDTKFVIEAANGPTTPEGDKVLRDRGIVVLPDIYTNAGVSSFYVDPAAPFSILSMCVVVHSPLLRHIGTS